MGMRKDLTVTVQMSRASDHKFHVDVVDEASRMFVCQFELDVEQFADLMSTRHAHEVPLTATVDDRLGKRMENQSVVIPGLSYGTWDDYDKIVSRFMAANFPDWTPDSRDDRFNTHRQKDDGYQITIRRWVEVD